MSSRNYRIALAYLEECEKWQKHHEARRSVKAAYWEAMADNIRARIVHPKRRKK